MNLKGSISRDIALLEKKYGLTISEIAKHHEMQNSSVPISVFNYKLGSLETIVKYLKENMGFSYKEISNITGRDIQPIRTTYERTRQKFPSFFKKFSDDRISLQILLNKKLSVLENIVKFLLDDGRTIEEISIILKRNYKTIWTIQQRIKRKE